MLVVIFALYFPSYLLLYLIILLYKHTICFYQSYLDFMLVVFFVGAIITYFMLPYDFFMETIGFLATFIEAMLGKLLYFSLNFSHRIQSNSWLLNTMNLSLSPSKGAPQFIRNFKSKSTQGMSIMMVVLWTVGDIFKTCYYKFRNAPAQFWACGLLQVSGKHFKDNFNFIFTHASLVFSLSLSLSLQIQISLDLAILFQVFLYGKNTAEPRSVHRGD